MSTGANVTSIIDTLDVDQRAALYQSTWTCQAVFRSLPPLAKVYVMDLLQINFPVAKDVISNRCSDLTKFKTQHEAALRRLVALNIFLLGKAENNQATYQLHPTFQSQLQSALCTGGRLIPNVPDEVLAAAPTPSELDEWAHSQWEALQMYLLGTDVSGPQLPRDVPLMPLDVHRLLVSARLTVGTRTSRAVTDKGFQFLLSSSHSQLWSFLEVYIGEARAASTGDLAALMSFVMQLGFMKVGQPYALSDLTHMEQRVAGHMMQLGVLMPFQAQGTGYYCPTRLASSLCASEGGGRAGLESSTADIAGGHIIVEPNYKVYAKTTSRVQRSLLEQFCRCDCFLPNFWAGSLTHENVSKALKGGISADEIISYLQSHADPQLVGRLHLVPENVTDQIRLWEAENHRLQAEAAVFYDSFENLPLYEQVMNYAIKHGWVLWTSPDTKAFVAKEQGHEQIKEAIKAVKAAQAKGTQVQLV